MTDWTDQLKWNGITYAVVGAVGLLTIAGLYLFTARLRGRWLALPRLRPGPWTGHEVFLAFCVMLGVQDLILVGLLQVGFFVPLIGDPPEANADEMDRFLYSLRSHALSSPLILVLILGILLPMMYARTGTRPPHYGLTWARWPANLALGIVAFLVARPMVIGIYAVALLIFPRSDPFSAFTRIEYPGWEWALFAFQTTVVAPVLEEVLCRGILQGWLRRASLHGHLMFLTLTLFMTAYFHSNSLANFDFGGTLFIVVLALGYGYALFHLARQFKLNETEIQRWQPLPRPPSLDARKTGEEEFELRRQAREQFERRAQAWADVNATLAIFGSALFFAVLHPNWPAGLALFPMGLLLGWLYRRTQSLVAPITFHALFNLATFIALYGMIWGGQR